MTARSAGPVLLSARAVTYTPPGAEKAVLNGISFDLSCGELVDVTGPSGSGKTTFLRALARLLPGASGTLVLDGVDSGSVAPRVWRTRVALLPQVATMREGSVRDNLRLPWALKVRAHEQPPSDEELEAALALVGLDDIDPGRDASRLSVGQAARVSLLRVTLTRPDVLLLDEPDANLDDESAARVAELTQQFARDGGSVMRVRHMRRGEDGTRTVRVAGGSLEEVGA